MQKTNSRLAADKILVFTLDGNKVISQHLWSEIRSV